MVDTFMKTKLSQLTLVCLAVVCLGVPSRGQPATEANWTLDEKPSGKVPAKTAAPLFDIPEPLRKLFPFLNDIEREATFGRQRGDAGTLLNAVKNLGKIESMGNSSAASSSADRLLEEATEIAWQQRDPEALREALVLWAAPNRSGRKDKVLDTSDKLEQVEKERGEMLTKKRCSIVFYNRTDQPVKVFVNRKPVGTLAAGEKHVVGDLLAGRQYLSANDDVLEWGPRKVYVAPGEVFNWRLFD